MVSSSARTVKDYLASLPADRRAVIGAVRDLVNANLPAGYSEAMVYGMIGWGVPLSRHPNTYNGQPLGIVGLAAQKNYCSLYLMSVYADPALCARFEAAWAATGKKLDMGKSCLRFKRVDDLAVDVVADALRWIGPEELIARHEAVHGSARQQRAATSAPKKATKSAVKKATKTAAKKTTKTATKKTTKTAATKMTKTAARKTTKTAAKKTATKGPPKR